LGANFSNFLSTSTAKMELEFLAEELIHGVTTASHCSPVVLLSMLDHYTRCEKEERAMGVLLGYRHQKPNHVQINNTFPLLYTNDDQGLGLDLELMREMLETVEEQVVGWYFAGGQIDQLCHEIHVEMSANVKDYQSVFMHLDIDSIATKTDFIKTFVSTPIGLDNASLFLEIPCETSLEKMDLIHKLNSNQTTDIKAIENSFEKINELLSQIGDFVDQVVVLFID
jgi:hypothetical protein